jgi:hypothetical protein
LIAVFELVIHTRDLENLNSPPGLAQESLSIIE